MVGDRIEFSAVLGVSDRLLWGVSKKIEAQYAPNNQEVFLLLDNVVARAEYLGIAYDSAWFSDIGKPLSETMTWKMPKNTLVHVVKAMPKLEAR